MFLFSVETVLKVSNALSQEIELENLLQKVIDLIQENTNAEKIYLLMEDQTIKDLTIFAQLSKGLDKKKSLSEFDRNTMEIIRYTHKSKTKVTIENAFADSRFSQPDPKQYSNSIKSVSCLPLMNRMSLVGVLYLENNSLAGAFVESR